MDTIDRSTDRILLMPEIEQLTRKPQGTLRYWRHEGRGPRLWKQGRQLCAWESDVRAWMRAQEEATSTRPAIS
jgi:predicted DNA-binding transcriptional regulator AlpA